MLEKIPIYCASDVLAEFATEEELDDDMTYIFWAWDGKDDEDEWEDE